MASTFFGLTIAGSALNSFQAAMNTTANNISNVNTKGYTRQQAVRYAAEALRVNERYGMTGSGVVTTEITQTRDFYYDVKYWENNAKLGLYDSKLYYAQQIENFLLNDDEIKGFTTIMDEMFAALDDVRKTPEDRDARQAFISKSQNFADFFHSMYVGLQQIQEDCNQEISTQVDQINGIAQKIALLNRQINVIELQGVNANELRDQRAVLIDELSDLVQVDVKETNVVDSQHPDVFTGGTNFVLKINGQTLVDSFDYRTLEIVARDKKVNQSDADGLYDIRWKGDNIPFNVSGKGCTGRLKALFDMRDGNNNEGFSGIIQSVRAGDRGDIVTIMNPSITDINSMNMADDGIITLNNKDYRYSGFSYNAETKTYEFQLKRTLSLEEREDLNNRKVNIGDSIDAMGIPYYQAQANSFLREFAKQMNNLQKSGVDADAQPAGAFFVAGNKADGNEYGFEEYDASGSMSTFSDDYYRLTAGNVKVSTIVMKNPDKMSTISAEDYANGVANQKLVEDMLKLKKDVKMFRGGPAEEFLKCLITDNSVDTQKSEMFCKNYSNISETIIQKRMSISAVDEDEEALDMIKFQNAYNLASKMIQTLAEMYDRLILETGV